MAKMQAVINFPSLYEACPALSKEQNCVQYQIHMGWDLYMDKCQTVVGTENE